MPRKNEPLPTDPTEPMTSAPEEVQELMKRVLLIEKQKLHQERPNVNDDIVRAIKDVIK